MNGAVDLHTRFPPSFENNPLSYGAALFSLTVISALSLAVLIAWAIEPRRNRQIHRRTNNLIPPETRPPLSPVDLHRLIVSGILLTVVFGALPDAIMLLAWGEASDATMENIFAVDRFFDSITILPFVGSMLVMSWAGQAVGHVLGRQRLSVTLKPKWFMVQRQLRLIGVVLLIAAGVTYGKSLA